MSKENILIAEDDPVLREVYVRKFSRSGYAIRTAENGDIAVRMVSEQAPTLLICDIMMPEHDGWWVLSKFPKAKRDFPVIMLTNLSDDATRERSKKLADGYFVKKDMTLLSLVEMAKNLLASKAKPGFVKNSPAKRPSTKHPSTKHPSTKRSPPKR